MYGEVSSGAARERGFRRKNFDHCVCSTIMQLILGAAGIEPIDVSRSNSGVSYTLYAAIYRPTSSSASSSSSAAAAAAAATTTTTTVALIAECHNCVETWLTWKVGITAISSLIIQFSVLQARHTQ